MYHIFFRFLFTAAIVVTCLWWVTDGNNCRVLSFGVVYETTQSSIYTCTEVQNYFAIKTYHTCCQYTLEMFDGVRIQIQILFGNTGLRHKIHHHNYTYMYIHTIELVMSKTVGIYVKTINKFTYV